MLEILQNMVLTTLPTDGSREHKQTVKQKWCLHHPLEDW